jgi:protein-disulfide isomerase
VSAEKQMALPQRSYWITGLVLAAFFTAPVLLYQGRFFAPTVSFTASELARAQGPRTAPIRIVEYSNFTCPACQEVQPTLAHLLSRYPGKIRYEFRHFPVVNDHRSIMAHAAAEAAAEQGHFWPYHHRLFQDRALWIGRPDLLEVFVKFALDLGLDGDRFSRSFFDPRTLKRVEKDVSAGRQLGVRATPTFFIQDKIFVGPRQLEQEGEAWIEEVLRRSAG